MAITCIHPISQPLIKSIRYACNPDKTDGGHWIQAYNCPQEPPHAYRAMMNTKAHHEKTGGVQGHSILFSFAPGEVSKEKAFDILNTFAQRYLAGKYETVVAMHTDQEHLHGHIVFNSVSYKDGQKYHSNAQEYYGQIRRIADELCRENGLHVTIPGGGKTGKHYLEWQLEKRGFTTWKEMARSDIDMALRHSVRFPDFLIKLENMGYSVNNDPGRKHVTIQPPGMTSRIRLNTLGAAYSEEAIKTRIKDNINHYQPIKKAKKHTPRIRTRYSRDFLRGYRGKVTGFQAMYLRYLYMLGKVQKAGRVKRRYYPLRQDVKNTHKHMNVYRFIRENGLSSIADVEAMRREYEKAYHEGKARIETLRQEEKPLKDDFRLLAEYERLRPAHRLYGQGHGHIESIEQAAADFLAVRAELSNRGYESEEKIQTLSEKKADIYERKDQAKAHQGQVRAVLKGCKNVLQSHEKMMDTRRDMQQAQREKQQPKAQRLQKDYER